MIVPKECPHRGSHAGGGQRPAGPFVAGVPERVARNGFVERIATAVTRRIGCDARRLVASRANEPRTKLTSLSYSDRDSRTAARGERRLDVLTYRLTRHRSAQ
jgi:hypothetical protein